MALRNVWLSVCLLLLLDPSYAFHPIDAAESNLVQFISESIRKDFRHHGDSFIIQYRGASNETQSELHDFVGDVLRRCEGVPWHLGDVVTSRLPYKIEKVILCVDSYESMIKVIDSGKLRSIFGFDVKCLVVLLAGREAAVEDTMQRIFYLLNSVFVLSAVIAVPGGSEDSPQVDLYTYGPYEAGQCGSTRPQQLSGYTGQEDVRTFTSLYKPVEMNLNGCPLTAVVTNMPNFIAVAPNNSISGIDAEHIKILSEKMNFTVKTIAVSTPGNVLEDGSTTGVFEKLSNREANFSMSGMSYFPTRLRTFSASQPYYQGGVFIALEVDTLQQALDSTLRPYQTSVWSLLVALFVFRFLCLVFLRLYWSKTCPRSFRRFMVAMWLIAMFYYRTFYESICYSFMQNPPREPIPSTLRQMSQQGYRVLADYSTRGFFEYFVDFNETVQRVAMDPVDAYDMVSHRTKVAVATKEEHFAAYMSDHPERRDGFVIVPEVLFVDLFCVYFPRNTYLKKWFDDVLARIDAAGLTKSYIQKYIGSIDRYLKNSMTVNKQPSGSVMNSISLAQLRSLFIIYFIGLTIATAALFLERISLRLHLLRKFLEWV